MEFDVLAVVQQEQFRDKPRAEQLLLEFIRSGFPLDVVSVELRPLAVSLNSFNGFLRLADGHRLFFKTHIEPDSSIDEYYNGSSLAAAGYPVIQAKYSSTRSGRQLLIYEVVEDPTVFDIAWEIDNGDETHLAALAEAQRTADRDLAGIYTATLEHDRPETEEAPVHQLFYHRLAGERYRKFYAPETGIELPGGPITMASLLPKKWQINGRGQDATLAELISRSTRLLRPSASGPSVIGHGDAHNGNVFFDLGAARLTYFDPAFAGRHDPFLDLTKPLFHNVFAMWMYYPQEIARRLEITVSVDSENIVVEHNHQVGPVRSMFLDSKIQNAVIPVALELRRRGWLVPEWKEFLKAALLCCPLLTMNLADRSKFPPEISALGLAYVVEMGSESVGERSVIDQALDRVTEALG